MDCPFKRSTALLRSINAAAAPFEIVTLLRQTHKEMTEEIQEYASATGAGEVAINGDIVIASLMTVFLNAQLEHPLAAMTYVQYFSYIDYSITEVGKSFEGFTMRQ